MHAAIRPYMTTGIAIVGASVIAVAPVTVPPPELPSVEVVAADVVPLAQSPRTVRDESVLTYHPAR